MKWFKIIKEALRELFYSILNFEWEGSERLMDTLDESPFFMDYNEIKKTCRHRVVAWQGYLCELLLSDEGAYYQCSYNNCPKKEEEDENFYLN